MQFSVQIDTESPVSLQEQLIGQIRTSIAAGRIKPGSQLPGSRALSEQLGISRNTVLLAYDSLGAEGYLESRGGAGTYVSPRHPSGHYLNCPALSGDGYGHSISRVPDPCAARERAVATATPPDFDFELEGMDPEIFPGNVWRRLMMRRMQSSNLSLTRNDAPYGLRQLREALRGFLGVTRGMTVDVEQIVVVTGIQQALNVVGHLMVRPGTPVVTEAPGCSMIAGLYDSYGGISFPVVADTDGIKVAQLPACRGAVVLVTPSRHFPLGGVLSAGRRQALLEWAHRTDSYVVDVDFDSDFCYDGSPPPSLQTHDRTGRFIYTGSFSMTIGPGLRIGYMVLPPHLVDPAKRALKLLDYGFPCHGAPWLDQAVLTDFIESGGYSKHLRVLRRNYLERRDCLIDALRKNFGDVDLRGIASGTHLTWRLSDDFANADECTDRARTQGVAVYTLTTSTLDGTDCIVDADHLLDWDRYLLLGFGSMRVSAIPEAVARIARAIG